LLEGREARIDRDEDGVPKRVWVSAQTGQGLDLLQQVVSELLGDEIIHKSIEMQPELGKLRALFYSASAILNEVVDDDGKLFLEIRMQKADFEKTLRQAGVNESQLKYQNTLP